MMKELIEGLDFYLEENDHIVFTAKYLLERGECCGSGCRHCPYNYINVTEPKRSELLFLKQTNDYQK